MSNNAKLESLEFGKYESYGSYHWRLTYPGKIFRASPRNHALYDASLDILTSRLGRNLEFAFGADVGCGDGVLLYKVRQRKGRIIGIDFSPKGLQLAVDEIVKRTSRRPEVVNGSCYELPLAPASLDYVLSTELIEHLQYDQNFIKEVARVLRPGGIFICTTPWRLPHKAALHDPYHVREYTPVELHDVLSRGLGQVSILGLYPVWLDRLYMLNRPRILGQGIRATFKILAFYYNPYRKMIVSNPTHSMRCANLIGVGQKMVSR